MSVGVKSVFIHSGYNKIAYLLHGPLILGKLTVPQLVKNFLHCMEPRGSLLHSQVPATCPCPEPDQSNPSSPSSFLKIHFHIILSLCLGLPSALFPSGLTTETLYTPVIFPTHAACPTHFILDLITQIMIL